MDFSASKRRRKEDDIVPMINVVFLLLVFFLISAQIAPPDPVEVSLPTAAGDAPSSVRDGRLYVDNQGGLHFDGHRDEAALDALVARINEDGLEIRADATTDGRILARLLNRLAALGIGEVVLVTVEQ